MKMFSMQIADKDYMPKCIGVHDEPNNAHELKLNRILNNCKSDAQLEDSYTINIALVRVPINYIELVYCTHDMTQ